MRRAEFRDAAKVYINELKDKVGDSSLTLDDRPPAEYVGMSIFKGYSFIQ